MANKYSSNDFRYYFAMKLSDYSSLAKWLKGADVLASFTFLRQSQDKSGKYLDLLKKHSGHVMIDSGAFTNFHKPGTVGYDEWLEFMKDNKSWADEYIQFDSIKSRSKTVELYHEAKKAGLDPHFVDHLWAKTYIDEAKSIWKGSDKVAVSGTAATPSASTGSFPSASMDRYGEAFQQGRDLDTHTHLLGAGSLRRFLPNLDRVHSADSASWGRSTEFGTVLFFTEGKIGDFKVPVLAGFKNDYSTSDKKAAPKEIWDKCWKKVVAANGWDNKGYSKTFKVRLVNIYHSKRYAKALRSFDSKQLREGLADKKQASIIQKGLYSPTLENIELSVPDFNPIDPCEQDYGLALTQGSIDATRDFLLKTSLEEGESSNASETKNALPEHFGSGENIEIFGYKTENFEICKTAVMLFKKLSSAEDETTQKRIVKAAKYLDEFFGIEKSVVDSDNASLEDIETALDLAILFAYEIGLVASKVGMSLDRDIAFIKMHFRAIVERMSPSEKAEKERYPKVSPSDFGDPENRKYPIDTYEHVRAAISYFSMPENANKYSVLDQKKIWERIKAAAEKFDIEVSADSGPPSLEKIEKARLPLWGSTAGKSRVAKRTAKLIPQHKTYVEPFAGGAAVFYAKDKNASQKEVLSDTHPEVAFAFSFARDVTEDALNKLAKRNWVVSKEIARDVHDLSIKDPVDRFYRFTYKRAAMFFRNENRITAVDPAKVGKKLTIIDRIAETKERLKNVAVHNESYAKVFSKYDASDTFFYLDPPYPRMHQEVGEKNFDESLFINNLKKLKGKFLLHYDVRDKAKFINKGWNVRVISVFKTGGHTEATVAGKLLEVANYQFPKETSDTEKAETYTPPKAVQNAAAKGLELRRSWERGGLDVSEASDAGIGSGVQRATNLKNGDNISLSTIKRMRNFFSRHQSNYKPGKKMPDGGPTAGTIAWLLWGGDPGKAWVNSILKAQEKSEISWMLPIAKIDEDEQLVTGIVLEPNETDAQGDTVTPEAIKEAAYRYLSKYNKATKLGFMHKAFNNLGISLVESWISRDDTKLGTGNVKRGSWLMTVHVENEKLWKRIKDGKITGFSIGGLARVSR